MPAEHDRTATTDAATTRPPLAEALDLQPHPEGGWYAETWAVAGADVHPLGYPAPRAAATGIYFLLAPGEESAWHVVRSDELWLWHRGGPLLLSFGGTGERPDRSAATSLVLGPDVAAGQRPQLLVPGGVWQAARPLDAAEETLVSCVVSPGFAYEDFRLEPPEASP